MRNGDLLCPPMISTAQNVKNILAQLSQFSTMKRKISTAQNAEDIDSAPTT